MESKHKTLLVIDGVINLALGGLLLLFIPFDIPLRGKIILWSIAVGVILIGVIELFAKPARPD